MNLYVHMRSVATESAGFRFCPAQIVAVFYCQILCRFAVPWKSFISVSNCCWLLFGRCVSVAAYNNTVMYIGVVEMAFAPRFESIFFLRLVAMLVPLFLFALCLLGVLHAFFICAHCGAIERCMLACTATLHAHIDLYCFSFHCKHIL